jgi:hypothetical protein
MVDIHRDIMRRSVLPIIGLMILSVIILHSSSEVEAVGAPTITLTVNMNYTGSNPIDPIDISTGFVGYDPLQSPTGEEIVTIEGTVSISSEIPQFYQRVIIELESWVVNERYGDVYVDYDVIPNKLIFTSMMPGVTYSSNFTMLVTIDGFVPAGENDIYIGGTWIHQPGPTGGSISPTTMPVYVAPVVSAGFIRPYDDFTIDPNENDTGDTEFIINGNVKEPQLELEFIGLEDTSESDLYITYTLSLSMICNWWHIEVFTGDVQPEDEWDVTVNMIDIVNDTILDSFDFTITIAEPEPRNNHDEDPIELLSAEKCDRQYEDDMKDELFYRATLYESEWEKGTHPKVDATEVLVYREKDDLVVATIAVGTIGGFTVPMIYILPDDSFEQRDMYIEDIETANILEYEPPYVLASNDMFSKGEYWQAELERAGNVLRARGSLEQLMEFGLDENFEVFVQLLDLDPSFLLAEDIYDMEIELVVDYCGFGAGDIKVEERPDPLQPMSIGEALKYIGIGAGALILIVFIIIFIALRKAKKKRRSLLK